MAEEALSRHRGTRHAYIRHVSNAEREILDILQNFEPQNEESVTVLESLRDGLTDKLVKIKAIDDSILALLDQKESEKELDDIIPRDDKVRLTLTKLERNFKKLIESSLVHSSSISNGHKQNDVKFARQKLSSKSSTEMSQIGLAFGTRYDSAIHPKQNISDIDKFMNLKSCLCDSTNSVISGLTLTSENYKEAIDLLRQRSANPQVLISAHMKKFVSLNNVKIVHDVKGLRKLFDTVESSIRNLKTLKVELNLYGSLLVPLLNAKLPKELSLQIARNFEDDVWPLEDMMKVLKNEIQAKERLLPVGTSFDLLILTGKNCVLFNSVR